MHAKVPPAKKPRSKRNQVEDSGEDSDSASTEREEGGTGSRRMSQRVMREASRTPKELIVADILCRWWYCMPDWPPADYDYSKILERQKLRVVTLDAWEEAPEIDSAGRIKCYALSQYKGLYRDTKERLHDLRPSEGKPCFARLINLSERTLCDLLLTALRKQIEVLSSSKNDQSKEGILDDLKKKLKETETISKKIST